MGGRPLPSWIQDDPTGKLWFYHRKQDRDTAIVGPLLASRGGKESLRSSGGIVDSAAKPYIIALKYPALGLRFVYGNGYCRLETKVINAYLAQFHGSAYQDTAFESCTNDLVRPEPGDLISIEDVRFSDLTNYWEDLHFRGA